LPLNIDAVTGVPAMSLGSHTAQMNYDFVVVVE
jgi:hypothetical protein